jgi:molecular chaperone DnaK
MMGTRKKIRLHDREFSPEQLSSFLLQKIKRDAEAFLGEPVEKAVVTVPAYFDDNQRSATKDACRIAGIEVARLVNEPTAAALAYGLDRVSEELRIAVVDFGGGTLDVTIMEFGKGVFEVKATSGDTRLGGTDMDQRLLDHLAGRFRDETGADLQQDPRAMARLREATEIAKIELSTSTTTHISLPYITAVNGEPRHLELDLTRTELERQVREVIERCRGPVEQALGDAGVKPGDIDRIVFVGGPTRMPSVRTFFEDLFGRKAEMGIDPMECVASGAAIQAGVLSGEVSDIVLVDVTPLTLGVETLGGVATSLIARNTPIPIKHTETFTTAADMQTAVTVHVYQGERPMADDNTSLGEFNLDGIPPAARGVPKIDVTFDIDANGILNVTASDQASGRSQSISITGSTRLAEDEKERMVREAEQYAEQDKQRREQADTLNEADATCYQAEKMLADFGDRLSDEVTQQIEQGLRDTRAALVQHDAALAKERAAKLAEALKHAGSEMYAATGASDAYKTVKTGTAAPSGEPRPSGSGPRGRVVDADYEESP